jgi:hypothetical protein
MDVNIFMYIGSSFHVYGTGSYAKVEESDVHFKMLISGSKLL